jgi:ATP-dependent DNA ligase
LIRKSPCTGLFRGHVRVLPTGGIQVPTGPQWLHEIKYDGFRLRVERNGDRVRLITRGGYDWTRRYPWIVEAALKNRHKHFVIDGEAVILGVDGYSDFNALFSGKHNAEVQLYAFDALRNSLRCKIDVATAVPTLTI